MKFNKDDPRVYAFILTITCTIILGILTLIFCREDNIVRAFMVGMTYGVAIFPQFICRAVISKMQEDDKHDSDAGSNTQHE